MAKIETETRGNLRLLFLLLSVLLLVLFTWLNLPYPYIPSNKAEILDCPASSQWCVSTNRLLKNPTRRPQRNHNHSSDTPLHPLDPLTIQEFNKVRRVVASQALFKSKPYVLHSVGLEEPDKSLVLRWKYGDLMLPRRASVVARVDGRSYVLTVDLDSGRVTRQEMVSSSGYPSMTIEDMNTASSAPMNCPGFNRTIMDRRVDPADLVCLPVSSGTIMILWFFFIGCFILYYESHVRDLKIKSLTYKF